MIFFLDASSLVKLYHQEAGTETMRELFRQPDYAGAFFSSDHVVLEVVVTINKLRRIAPRRQRREFDYALDRFEYDRSQYLNILEVQASTMRETEFLAADYANSGAGTLDFIHLASALAVQSVLPGEQLVFLVSDRKLKHLVRRGGLQVFDPEQQELKELGQPRIL